MAGDSMDAVFGGLATASHPRILDIVRDRHGCTVNYVTRFFATSRVTVLKHLRVLQAAGLIHSEKHGRERRLYFNVVPIQIVYDRWTTEYSKLWAKRLTEIKYRVEAKGKGNG